MVERTAKTALWPEDRLKPLSLLDVINPPLSLYIHLPWCVRSCPYCDFNSHEIKNGAFPEKDYIDALVRDIQQSVGLARGREILSIFFGGGTPSVISAQGIERVLQAVHATLTLPADAEITLEANPGAADQQRFADYKGAGINRLSIGVQSFDDHKLAHIGRVHDGRGAFSAIEAAHLAGFSNINIDLMYGLPGQTPEESLGDLKQAIGCAPTHISWYQLTIEPNTLFYSHPPALPDSDACWQMQRQGQRYLSEHQYGQYEIAAYSRAALECQHNMNYWRFGDYLGVGAGAHGKLTDERAATVMRQSKRRVPASYIRHAGLEDVYAGQKRLSEPDLILEFMLNVLRLKKGVPRDDFTERTGVMFDTIHEQVTAATEQGLLADDQSLIRATEKGSRFLNDLLQYFMPEPVSCSRPPRR